MFYLSVFHPNGNNDTLYKLHVYRLDMKTYTFVNGVTQETIKCEKIEENSLVDAAVAYPDNAGYTFVGWTVDGQEITFPYIVTKNVTFVATYLAHENTLKFDGNGAARGETPEMKIHTDETKTLTANGFIRIGYTFVGWSLTEDGEKVYDDEARYKMGVESEYTLYAVWIEGTKGLMYSLTNDEYCITGYTGTDTIVVIPAVYYGYPVTSIGDSAFSSCNSLEEITIPFVGEVAGKTASDTYQYPFGYIFGVSSYTGGTAVKRYYYGSSTSSTTSTTYYIPSSLRKVTVTGGNILYGSFYGCSSLTSINIPANITSIGSSAFSGYSV